MKLIVVRHGETEDNVNEILQGASPGILTEKGKEQAKKLGERLKQEKIDYIYVSDLKRTVDTAAEIIKYHPEVPVTYTDRLRKRDFGIYEGIQVKEFADMRKSSGIRFKDYRPEKGESLLDVKKRIDDFLDEIFKKHFGETILWITHGSFIASLKMSLENIDITLKEHRKIWTDNTAVAILEFDKDKNHEIKLLTTDQIISN